MNNLYNQQTTPSIVFQQNNIVTQQVDITQFPSHFNKQISIGNGKQMQTPQQLNTIQPQTYLQQQQDLGGEKPASRQGQASVTLRKSAARKLNSTIDVYKKPQNQPPIVPSGRITQNMIVEPSALGPGQPLTTKHNRSRTNMQTNLVKTGDTPPIMKQQMKVVNQIDQRALTNLQIRDQNSQLEFYMNEQVKN